MWPVSTQSSRRTLFLWVGLLCIAQTSLAAPTPHPSSDATAVSREAERYIRNLLRPRVIRVDYEDSPVAQSPTVSRISQLTFDPLGLLEDADKAAKVASSSPVDDKVVMDPEAELFIVTLQERFPATWRTAVWMLPAGLLVMSYALATFVCSLWASASSEKSPASPLAFVVLEKGLPHQTSQKAQETVEEASV